MEDGWFKKKRRYRHFDMPVGKGFAAKVANPGFVARHPFSPLIHYMKEEKRYKKCPQTGVRAISVKSRPIKYASHRDSCILSYYAHLISERLEEAYKEKGISSNVIAYRSLGRANYHFAADAYMFARSMRRAIILAFDVTGFFDNLDHRLLKAQLKRILNVGELREDWFRVFRFMTRFRYVHLDDLKADEVIGPRLLNKADRQSPLATMAELKARGINIYANPSANKGIPQGTPISAVFSNLYMLEFDLSARAFCDERGALYRRYSDDILVICPVGMEGEIEEEISRLMVQQRLSLSQEKTERTLFDAGLTSRTDGRAAQYLGFNISEDGPAIRQSSLSRQWRKMRKAFRRTRRVALEQIAAGKADRVWTKRLRRRFTSLQFRNFSSYGRRSARAFGADERIIRQIRRFERAAERELRSLETLNASTSTD